jgi:hypothetical protein
MLLRKRITVLLSALSIMVVMSVPAYSFMFVDPSSGELAKSGNNGNQLYDGGDANQGGGQEAPKKAKHADG